MSYSILSQAQNTRNQALAGLRDAANRETELENAQKQFKAAKAQQTASNIGAGAGLGAAIAMGTSVGGPVGALAGAGVGLLASLF